MEPGDMEKLYIPKLSLNQDISSTDDKQFLLIFLFFMCFCAGNNPCKEVWFKARDSRYYCSEPCLRTLAGKDSILIIFLGLNLYRSIKFFSNHHIYKYCEYVGGSI